MYMNKNKERAPFTLRIDEKITRYNQQTAVTFLT